jgi:chaperonin GroES
MKTFCIFLALVVCASALNLGAKGLFKARRCTQSRIMMGNVLDGVDIDGDLKPMGNSLLIKVKEALSETKGGLFIPDNAKERPTEGTVIANGPGRVHPETAVQLDIAVKAGQAVMYGKYDGSELRYNDAEHQLIKDDDVLLKYPAGEEAVLANVECVKDQILIELAKEEATEGGLIISQVEKEKRPDYGKVVKVGPGRQAGNGHYMTPQVAPGDMVRFRDFAGAQIKLDNRDYLVIRNYDILAKW